MNNTPKSLRLQIGLFGRTNVGKSSFLNLISGQDVAIVSSIPGTTTDVVEKSMELLPIGPVVFLDTAGIDDISVLAAERLRMTSKVYDRADIIVLVIEARSWGEYEQRVADEAKKRNTPLVIVINKIDISRPDSTFLLTLSQITPLVMECSCVDKSIRESIISEFKRHIIESCPDDFLNPPPLIGNLVRSGGLAVLIVPIDLEAPKGRLILPQVQTIRDILDNDAGAMIVKEREYADFLQKTGLRPDIAVCDSQVVHKMVADTPPGIPCTTFSILFSRNKGDLVTAARAAAAIETLDPGDKVLIAESCSHHPIEDDIGRVKIPRWLRQYVGGDLTIDTYAGRDYPDSLSEYKVVIHCGGCMLNRREMLSRIEIAKQHGVPITNYGIAISLTQGVLQRVLSPFPAALAAYHDEINRKRGEK
ncbi:MAG: [FeFe] hydrogenase H-cluster maturation GTPase HydF [Deltaproteobacteria bacterium]|nr:[FeFe] hydrogenase H-cluster maturation GTPase HydF [Deltaproteobacteria bacterium]